jgi:solute carrier family 25 thiamine pyrophosphate transporter 19
MVAKPMHLLCGGLAGIVTKTAFMPLDVIRKRLQVQGHIRQEILISNVPVYRGVFKAALQIIRDEGTLALYKGLVPSLVKAASSSAITFFVVQEMRQFFSNVNK